MNATQEEVYAQAAKPLIPLLMDGYNVTLVCHGAKSAGKTFSCFGTDYTFKVDQERATDGVFSRLVKGLFDTICEADESIEFTIRVACYEIMCDSDGNGIIDLLNGKKNLNFFFTL